MLASTAGTSELSRQGKKRRECLCVGEGRNFQFLIIKLPFLELSLNKYWQVAQSPNLWLFELC